MSAAAQPEPGALIPVRHQTTAELSAHWSGRDYRASASRPPKYLKAPSGGGRHCAECAWRQHETRGASGPRMRPAFTRSLPSAPELEPLLLCGRHAEAWRERDRRDGADPDMPKPRTAKRTRR